MYIYIYIHVLSSTCFKILSYFTFYLLTTFKTLCFYILYNYNLRFAFVHGKPMFPPIRNIKKNPNPTHSILRGYDHGFGSVF